MRRRKLSQLVYDNYPMCNQAEKELAQELVFQFYYDRNEMDLESALQEIQVDIVRLEEHEQYERCAMLKDILDRFE